MIEDIHVGDHVRVDGDRHAYRVEAKNTRTGELELEALSAYPAVTLWIHEFHVQKVQVF